MSVYLCHYTATDGGRVISVANLQTADNRVDAQSDFMALVEARLATMRCEHGAEWYLDHARGKLDIYCRTDVIPSPESEPAPVAGTVSAKVARAASDYGIALRAQRAASAAYEAAIGTDKVIPLSDAYQLRARATEAALAVLNEALGLDTGGNDA